MTDLVYDYISMGVDMILTAAILSAIVVLLRSSVVLSSHQATLQANSDRMNYYKQYNMYDCTHNLCSADIISALVYYRYDLEMVVIKQDGSILVRNDRYGKFYLRTGGTDSEVSYDTLISTLGAGWTYDSWLVEDMGNVPSYNSYQGGLVTGLKFKITGTAP